MTKPSHQRSSIAGWLLIGIMGWFAGCTQVNESHGKDKTMATEQITLWQAISILAQQVPFTKAKVETVLSTHLIEKPGDYFGKDVSQYFKSVPVELDDGVLISNVDLRVKRTGEDPGFMVLEIEGACVTLKQVRSHYSTLTITGSPRGRSLDDATSHSTEFPWGKLSFGFAERNPECLAWIAFDPKKT